MKKVLDNFFVKSFCLLSVSLGLSLFVNAVRSSGKIPWVQDWGHYVEAKALKEGLSLASLDQTRAIVDQGIYVLFDARHAIDYNEGHIPGALSFPYDEIDTAFQSAQMYLIPEQPILTYCSGDACDDSFELALFLKEQGYTNMTLFAGGFNAWTSAELPVEGQP